MQLAKLGFRFMTAKAILLHTHTLRKTKKTEGERERERPNKKSPPEVIYYIV